jgi:hypothetical protein
LEWDVGMKRHGGWADTIDRCPTIGRSECGLPNRKVKDHRYQSATL